MFHNAFALRVKHIVLSAGAMSVFQKLIAEKIDGEGKMRSALEAIMDKTQAVDRAARMKEGGSSATGSETGNGSSQGSESGGGNGGDDPNGDENGDAN